MKLRQKGRHFADDIFKCIFLNENLWILLKISLKFIPKVWIHNIPALVQIMAWRQPGDKPLSEPIIAYFAEVYMHHSASITYYKVNWSVPSQYLNQWLLVYWCIYASLLMHICITRPHWVKELKDINLFHFHLWLTNRKWYPGSHYWYCYTDTLSSDQITSTDLKIRHPDISSTGVRFSISRRDLTTCRDLFVYVPSQ